MALPITKLDANQVLKHAYIDEEQALRVNTQATVVAGALEVAIDQSTDSIKIGDGTDLLAINPDGSISVNVIGSSSGEVKSVYGEVLNVVSGITTLITSYTVPSGKTASFKLVECSGENIATYTVYLDSVVIDKKRTYFGGDLNTTFNFSNGLQLTAGQQVTVEVVHMRPSVADFNARIQVEEI